jgi:hypothetical protein
MLKSEEPLGKPSCRWENKIEISLWEIGCQGVDWIHVPWLGSSAGLL